MTINRKTPSRPRKAPALPYSFPRPALMQTWGEVKELKNLREALMKEYSANITMVKILVHELAFYTWEIHELMKIRHTFTRRQYLDKLRDIAKHKKLVIDSTIGNAFIRRDPTASKMIDEILEDSTMDPGELIVTSMSRYKGQLEAIDRMITAAERRRSQLLKELDRYEMARILIAERKPR